jgi:acetyl esterase/lipase
MHKSNRPFPDMKYLLFTSLVALLTNAGAQTTTTTAPAKPAPAGRNALPPPTVSDVVYGSHPRQVLDFWKAESATPSPVLFYIHGGGWVGGDRAMPPQLLKPMLERGVSVVTISYRLLADAQQQGVEPPVKAPLEDAARALQFVRSKAGEWHLDPKRIIASGLSAGGCSSLWLAFHDDMADPRSTDPVSRQSTRLTAAAVSAAQTTLDPALMREWIPNIGYGPHAFGVIQGVKGKPASLEAHGFTHDFPAYLNQREKLLPWIKEYSPYSHVSPGDPPVYLSYREAPTPREPQNNATHSANFGALLKEHCDALKVPCQLSYPGAPDLQHKDSVAFILSTFGLPAAR